MYEYLDRVLKRLTAQIYRRYKTFRTLPFDEVNVFPNVKKLYDDLDYMTVQAFREIAQHYYKAESGKGEFTDVLLMNFLSAPSPVLMYSYSSEYIRKRDSFFEALVATSGDVAVIDKAMKRFTQMAGWVAVEVADNAIKTAREERGEVYVKWRSEHDSRTCGVCIQRDGNIYPLSRVPKKPHPNCRCWTEIIT